MTDVQLSPQITEILIEKNLVEKNFLQAIEANQVYTIEPGMLIKDFWIIAIEENILVRQYSVVFLSTPQTEIIVRK